MRIRTACAHNEPELLAALTSIARRDPPCVAGQPHQQQVQLLSRFQFRGKNYQGELSAGTQEAWVCFVMWVCCHSLSGYVLVNVVSCLPCGCSTVVLVLNRQSHM